MRKINSIIYSFCLMTLLFLVGGCTAGTLPALKYHVRTEAPIEKKFLEAGKYAVKHKVVPIKDLKLQEFHIWYPEELEKSKGKKYPLLVFCNGTNYRATRLVSLLKHLASWGFIVIDSEEEWSGKGRDAIMCLNYMLNSYRNQDSIFFKRIDLKNIGIAGHSQGGAGAINAITKYPEGRFFKALFTISGAKQEQASHWVLRCPYDPGKLRIPVMMTATSNPYGWDEANPEREHLAICPLDSMQKNRDDILKNYKTTVVIARVANKKKYHADNLAMSAPYMTAWFRYWLKGDREAGKFFSGNIPELKKNLCWQDVEIHHAN